jgi:hypothetical protein
MSISRLVGMAAALAVISALAMATAMTPAMAQQVISEPGYCAFFYPNANCQNKGPGNPYTDPRRFSQGYAVPDGSAARGVVAKKRTHRSRTSLR